MEPPLYIMQRTDRASHIFSFHEDNTFCKICKTARDVMTFDLRHPEKLFIVSSSKDEDEGPTQCNVM